MLVISHRGNTDGPIPHRENEPQYLIDAAKLYHVELDVWYHESQLWLGHDKPTYPTSISFLMNHKFWCHAKNIDALYLLRGSGVQRCFFHDGDDAVFTSDGWIWTYPGKKLTPHSICVLPERHWEQWLSERNVPIGVCTDYPCCVGSDTSPVKS